MKTAKIAPVDVLRTRIFTHALRTGRRDGVVEFSLSTLLRVLASLDRDGIQAHHAAADVSPEEAEYIRQVYEHGSAVALAPHAYVADLPDVPEPDGADVLFALDIMARAAREFAAAEPDDLDARRSLRDAEAMLREAEAGRMPPLSFSISCREVG